MLCICIYRKECRRKCLTQMYLNRSHHLGNMIYSQQLQHDKSFLVSRSLQRHVCYFTQLTECSYLCLCMLFTQLISKTPTSADNSDIDGTLCLTNVSSVMHVILQTVGRQIEPNTEKLALPKKYPRKRKRKGMYIICTV